MRQALHLQRFVRAAARFGRRHLAHLQGERDVLLDAHVREQRIVLEHHADIPFIRRAVGDIGAVDQHAALVGLRQAGDQAQQGGLAGAGLAHDRQRAATRQVKRHAVHRLDHDRLAVGALAPHGKVHGQVPDGQQCGNMRLRRHAAS
ncbi:hypothetical protein G6F40_015633 [Rhizopus arrhizus]|nr:hypothetical protein G6F40_015633 [Rhizopus arrhizus]